ncbi:Hypothetical predicted protein [Cloeon dipterum]|uniref:Bee-milk protein n=1 Tax=Cloeon dipterum TaxID=197152 RepID=A0A8S1DTU4_9INSE|nr:Hypothetical predicted protein [Cloeon dipterum]
MSPFLCVIFLLCLSTLATATKFDQVYEWDELDYEWPAEANRTKSLIDGTFKPEEMSPLYMAVFGSRLFLSLGSYNGIPVSLVTVPTSSTSTKNPKLTPFPSWDLHDYGKEGDCNKIEVAAGLQVDSIGRLWVLDSGSSECKAKLWIIDLINNDHTKLIHQFVFRNWMHDLVLDETADGTFAYISRWGESHIVVFNLKRKRSWMVYTPPKIQVISIAISPNLEEPRKLYLGKWISEEVYSISAATLRSGLTRRVKPKLIGKWKTTDPYRMLIDNQGTMYSAFVFSNNTQSWNTSQPFQAQLFHEDEVYRSPI